MWSIYDFPAYRLFDIQVIKKYIEIAPKIQSQCLGSDSIILTWRKGVRTNPTVVNVRKATSKIEFGADYLTDSNPLTLLPIKVGYDSHGITTNKWRRAVRLDRFHTPRYSRLDIHYLAYFIHGYVICSYYAPVLFEIGIGKEGARKSTYKWKLTCLNDEMSDVLGQR
jgi:hypothetical protein